VLLLNHKRLVRLADLEFGELGRALLAAALAWAAAATATRFLPPVSTHARDALTIAVASLAWAVAALATLLATGSALPRQLLRARKAPAAGRS